MDVSLESESESQTCENTQPRLISTPSISWHAMLTLTFSEEACDQRHVSSSTPMTDTTARAPRSKSNGQMTQNVSVRLTLRRTVCSNLASFPLPQRKSNPVGKANSKHSRAPGSIALFERKWLGRKQVMTLALRYARVTRQWIERSLIRHDELEAR